MSPLIVLALAIALLPGVQSDEALVTDSYFGSRLGELVNGVATGTVYAADDQTLFIKEFHFPGSSYPYTFFQVGFTNFPDGTGLIVPDERGSTRPLDDYKKKDIVIRLPEGRTIREFRWLAVWSRQIHSSLGHLLISPDVTIPISLEIPPLTGLAHGVRSGPITIVDAQTILVSDFWFDGESPTAYWWLTRGPRQSPQGLRLKDENGSAKPLRAYRGETLMITLPDSKSIYDFDWFGVWCEQFQVDFGHVNIPQHIRVPPSPRMLGLKPETKLNCEVLDDTRGFEVRWIMDNDDIVFQLVSRLNPREYMSLALGKDDTRSLMVGADAAVAWIDESGHGHVVDYYLASKEQCVGNRGSCPDLKHTGATDSLSLLHASIVNGYSMVTFKRPQLGVDELFDQHIYSDGQQAIMWAIGPLNSRNEVSYHTSHSYGNRFVNFARKPTWNCPRPDQSVMNQRKWQQLSASAATPSLQHQPVSRSVAVRHNQSKPEISETTTLPAPTTVSAIVLITNTSQQVSQVKPWKIPRIVCPKDRNLWAQIGPVGGQKKGYAGITGRQGWGIAWYINGLLVPELVLQRGVTYTFLVEGGNDEHNGARRHPLYLTTSEEGGFEYKTPVDRRKERVLGGVGITANGTIMPTAEGRLCEWKITPATHIEDVDGAYSTFEEFQKTLLLDCETKGQPGMIRFTPDGKTPDLLYYQCYTHRYLGWKIRIVDRCDETDPENILHSASIRSMVKVKPVNATIEHRSLRNKILDKIKSRRNSTKPRRGGPLVAPNVMSLTKPNPRHSLAIPPYQMRQTPPPAVTPKLIPFRVNSQLPVLANPARITPTPHMKPFQLYSYLDKLFKGNPTQLASQLQMIPVMSNVYSIGAMKKYGYQPPKNPPIQVMTAFTPTVEQMIGPQLPPKILMKRPDMIIPQPMSVQNGFIPVVNYEVGAPLLNRSQIWFPKLPQGPEVRIRKKVPSSNVRFQGDIYRLSALKTISPPTTTTPRPRTTTSKPTTTTLASTTINPTTEATILEANFTIPTIPSNLTETYLGGESSMTTTLPLTVVTTTESDHLEYQYDPDKGYSVRYNGSLEKAKDNGTKVGQASQRHSVYTLNDYGGQVNLSDKSLTIHSVIEHSQQMSLSRNSTDHTILSDVLRLIAQDSSVPETKHAAKQV